MKRYRRKFRRSKRRYGRRNSRFGLRRAVKNTILRMAETKHVIQNVNRTFSGINHFETGFMQNVGIGTGSEQRIGNQILVRGISFNLFMKTALAQQATVRVLVIWPKNGINTSELLLYATGDNPGVYGRADPDRFITMYDKRYQIVGWNQGAGMTFVNCKFNRFMKNWKVTFNDAGVANNGQQPIIYVTSDGVDSNSTMQLGGTVSLSFKDL